VTGQAGTGARLVTREPALLLSLQPISLRSALSVLKGGPLRPGGGRWHPEYPLLESMLALSTNLAAQQVSGWRQDRIPTWWMYQLCVSDPRVLDPRVSDAAGKPVVVGDIGFHGPPDPDDGLVEIGYAVVPSMRGCGVATSACAALVDRAWSDGARVIQADTEPGNSPSRRLLLSAGFRPQPDGSYRLTRPW
jgi:RimJ/RimL family protein N-acetyltransferase